MNAERGRLPKGVTGLSRERGGRGFRASLRRGKGEQVHLGLYATPWRAGYAVGVAATLLGRPAPYLEIPTGEEPGPEEVREIQARVRRRLGLVKEERSPREEPPRTEDLLTLFEVAVVGFWREQATGDGDGRPGSGVDAAAARLAAAAGMLFWSRGAGHPSPLEAMTELAARRLDAAFRRSDLTRAVLDDDGDEPWRVARWLVYPETGGGARGRGFREEVRYLYAEMFGGTGRDAGGGSGSGPGPGWAEVLGVAPPFTLARIREAFLTLSRSAHPDAGGSDTEFVRLREAFEAGRAYCEVHREG